MLSKLSVVGIAMMLVSTMLGPAQAQTFPLPQMSAVQLDKTCLAQAGKNSKARAELLRAGENRSPLEACGLTEREQGARFAGRNPSAALQTSGGPDDFGYSWSEVPFDWEDAGDGTNLNMSGPYDMRRLDLPFEFSFYENRYDHVWVQVLGELTFNNTCCFGFSSIGSHRMPNNAIAAYTAGFDLSSDGTRGRILSKVGGAAPSRYVIVQWDRVYARGGQGPYTFQVVLYESGDIIVKHQQMASVRNFTAETGIEDAEGLDGLKLQYWTSDYMAPSNHAYRFVRPAPRARMQVLRPYERGILAQPGVPTKVDLLISNNGDLGSDRADVSLVGAASSWPYHFEHEDGTLLSDTDLNGSIDTGTLAQNVSTTVRLVMTAPLGTPGFSVYNFGQRFVKVASARDPQKFLQVAMYASVPPAFALQLRDRPSEMSYLLSAGTALATANHRYQGQESPQGIMELDNGNLLAVTSRDTCCRSGSRRENYIEVLNQFGESVVPRVHLFDQQGESDWNVFDNSPAIARSHGRGVGLAWMRYRNTGSGYSYELLATVRNPDGSAGSSVVNIARSDVTDYQQGGIWMSDPAMAATDDGNFAVTWTRQVWSAQSYSTDVYFALLGSNGSVIKPATRLTSSDGLRQYYARAISAVGLHDVVIGYESALDRDLWMQRVGSDGSVVGSPVNVTETGTDYYEFNLTLARLQNGSIMAVWRSASYDELRYALFDQNLTLQTSKRAIAGSKMGAGDVQIIAYASNNVIVTWRKAEGLVLGYAMFEPQSGEPSVPYSPLFVASANPYYRDIASSSGNRATVYGSSVISSSDVSFAPVVGVLSGSPGGAAIVPLSVKNYGALPTGPLTLTVSLGNGLILIGSVAERAVPVAGRALGTYTWSVPSLNFLDDYMLNLKLSLKDDAAYGERLPISATVSSVNSDDPLGNNAKAIQVMAGRFIYVPTSTR